MKVKTPRLRRPNTPFGGLKSTLKGSTNKDSRRLSGLRAGQIRIRDLDRVLEIEKASFGADAWERKLFADSLEAGDLLLGAWRDGKLTGYLLAAEGKRRAELLSLAVDPAARRLGAASLLLNRAMSRLRRHGMAGIWLMVKTGNRAAEQCYEKFGFRRTRRVKKYYEDGADGWRMELEFRGKSIPPKR
ncbi:MAG TPA: GNAT family N-acetyltransferase [Bryobacteraceae bacterium]|nr:GNAT family N-acetyltransferase [Bryobacteraceae bacterium]